MHLWASCMQDHQERWADRAICPGQGHYKSVACGPEIVIMSWVPKQSSYRQPLQAAQLNSQA